MFIAARVEDPEVAADITHDVIVRSIASGALDRVDDPVAWLYRSARNAVIDHYRTRRSHEPIIDDERWPEQLDDGAPIAATRELARCLRPLLDRLPPSARDALERIDVGGQTQQRAAEELGLSVSGMKSRVQRARRALNDVLRQCCTIELDARGAIADYRPNEGGCGCSDASSAGCS